MIRLHTRGVFRICLFIILFIAVLQHSSYPRGNEVRVRGAEYSTPLVGNEQGEYYLGIGDQVKIFIMKNPDLSGSTTINPDGKVSYPLIGSVQAAGLTISQFQEKLKEKFSAFIRYPEITVTVEASSGKKVLVLGEVGYPGIYSFDGQISLMEAIALAGDVTRDSKRESIIIASDNFTDHPKVRRVNLFKALREGAPGKDCLLSAGDVVYVPRHFIADTAEFGRNLSAIMGGVDAGTNDLIDWRREIRHFYNTKINTKTNKAIQKP